MRIRALLAVGGLVLAGSACSSDDSGSPATSAATATSDATSSSGSDGDDTTVPVAPTLRILVTNDDGYASAGIDTLVEALRALPDVEITVVAPAENQSGTGDSVSADPVSATPAATASGYPATSVSGTPADSVNYALAEVFVDSPPDLVVSGSNEGQNLGFLTDVSGTVGAARTAARRGIPALAVSQGIADAPDYAAGVTAAVDWITEHRAEVQAFGDDVATVWSINAPTCATGTPRGVLTLPTATEPTGDEVLTDTDCTVADTDPADDVQAFNWGYITLSDVGLS